MRGRVLLFIGLVDKQDLILYIYLVIRYIRLEL